MMDLMVELESTINTIQRSDKPNHLQAFIEALLGDASNPQATPPCSTAEHLNYPQTVSPFSPSTSVWFEPHPLPSLFPANVFPEPWSFPYPAPPPSSVPPEPWSFPHTTPPPSVPPEPWIFPHPTPPPPSVPTEPWIFPHPTPPPSVPPDQCSFPQPLPPPPSVPPEPQAGQTFTQLPLPDNVLENMVPVGTVNGEVVYGLPPVTYPTVFPVAPARQKRPRRKRQRQQDDEQPYIKKPPNAFMLFLREQRPNVVAELNITNNAEINAELGQQWRSMSQSEKDRYFIEAEEIKRLHEQQFPQWSTRDNYGKKRKRIRKRDLMIANGW